MTLRCWLQDCHLRVFPAGNPVRRAPLCLEIAQGEAAAFQAVAYNPDPDRLPKIAVFAEGAPGLTLRVRRVGFVPMPHLNTQTPDDERDGLGHVPGFVPDPLFDEHETAVPPREAAPFWISVRSRAAIRPGRHPVRIRIECDGKTAARLETAVQVYDRAARPRRGFPVMQWFYLDALLDWYRLQPFEEPFWGILEAYLADLPAHGQDTVYTPVFTPPLDGVKRPSQLLHVLRRGRHSYDVDWSMVRRYVRLAARQGIRNFEWTHFFTQWGARHAIRIYEGHGETERLLWPADTPATSPVYRRFLGRFLPEFHAFLKREGLLGRSFFHVSDEPHGDEALANYKAARAMLLELAPWMKTMDALSEIVYGRDRITDMPVASIRVMRQFREEGIPCFAYFCCGPRGRYLNRLLDTPPAKIRMSGWLFYRFQALGFLHWGYNYWYRSQTRTLIDPFRESAGGAWPNWPCGDTFMVYPGPRGPIDSLRWEIFGLSLQDYALLQARGLDPDGPELKAFRGFDEFPKTLPAYLKLRRDLLA